MLVFIRKRLRHFSGLCSVIRAVWVAVPSFRGGVIFSGLSLFVSALGFFLSSGLTDVASYFGFAGLIATFLSAILALFSYQQIVHDHGVFVWRTRTVSQIARFGLSLRFSEIIPSASELNNGFSVHYDPRISKDVYMRSEEFDNEFILSNSIQIHIQPSLKWKFFLEDKARRLRQLQYLIVRVRASHLRTTNESKCRLRMNIEIPLKRVELAKVGYFDSLMTNEAFRSELYQWRTDLDREAESGETIDLTADFPVHQDAFAISKNTVRLDTLKSSAVSDHIGVTTLVVTADKKVLMLRQGKTTVEAHALLLGGSGSLDWGDISRSANSDCLHSILATGMAREFLEETRAHGAYKKTEGIALSDDRIRFVASNTFVVGYFRWVNRCGKPEFVGVTRSSLNFSDLKDGDGFEVWPWFGDVFQLESLNDFSEVRNKILELISERDFGLGLSALVALERLAEIAGYSNSTDRREMEIYKMVSEHLRLD